MHRPRLIPVLLISDGGLVKGQRFRDHSYVGDPINVVRIFSEKEADELIIVDIDASRTGRDPDYDLIEEITTNCFMPVTYGGGLSRIDQAQQVFALGVEKVCLQTSLLLDMELVRQLSERYGSQAVVASIDVVKVDAENRVFHAAKAVTRPMPWMNVMRDAIQAGAGEVLLTSVDREGTMAGVDLELVREAATAINVPLIAHGGVGSLGHVQEALDSGADAVGAGSFLVFSGPHRAVLITYPSDVVDTTDVT